MALSSPAQGFFDLLTRRKESEAAQYVRDQFAGGRSLASIYIDIFAPAIEEAGRRRACGRFNAVQETFVSGATERIMSTFAPLVFDDEETVEKAVIGSFGTGAQCRTLGIGAALLAIDGYDVCNVGADPSQNDLRRVLVELKPALCIFCVNAPSGVKLFLRAMQNIRNITEMNRPFVAVAIADAWAKDVRAAGVDLLVDDFLETVVAAQTKLTASERHDA